MPKPRKGLRVCYHDHVENLQSMTGNLAGWYVEFARNGRWYSIMDLRFGREKDALRAVQSLTVAGLNTYAELDKADGMTVKQVACEFLQW